MLSKNLENSTSYDIFFYTFGKKARVYYTLSISRGGGPGPRAPPPGFATEIYTLDTIWGPPQISFFTYYMRSSCMGACRNFRRGEATPKKPPT